MTEVEVRRLKQGARGGRDVPSHARLNSNLTLAVSAQSRLLTLCGCLRWELILDCKRNASAIDINMMIKRHKPRQCSECGACVAQPDALPVY